MLKQLEDQAHNDGDQCCQHHALHGKGTKGKLGTGQAYDHDNRGHDEVGGLAVIYLAFYQHADTAGGNYAKEQYADTAHNGNRYAVNQLAELTAEGKDDSKYGSTADNPGAVYLGDGHNADVFTIGGVGGGAGKAADDVGKTISKQGTGKSGILDQIAFNDIAGNDEVADVLSQYNQCCRSNDHDGVEIEDRCVKMRNLEPGCIQNRLEVDDTYDGGKYVTTDNAEKNGDDAHKAAEGNRADNADGEREHRNGYVSHIDFVTREAGHVGGNRSKLQADNGNDGTHGCRWEDDVNPFCAYIVNDDGKEHKEQTENNEAGLCMIIAGIRHDQKYRGDKGKAGAKVGRNLTLGDEDVKQRAQTVHKQAGGGAYLEQKRNQHGRAKHGKQMLET